MTYDQWKTTDPRELLPYDEDEPTELDLVYEQLHQAEATISRLTPENDRLRKALERISKGAVDGLDYARDATVLQRAIDIAKAALATPTESDAERPGDAVKITVEKA